MKVLVYKRTHTGDPNPAGCFGVNDCMGRVRGWGFQAAIGVGGVGPEPRSQGIDRKVTWIGLGAHKGELHGRGPLVTFDLFRLFDAAGPLFAELAPNLASHIYGAHVRACIVDGDNPEVATILALLSAPAQPQVPVTAPPARRRRGCA